MTRVKARLFGCGSPATGEPAELAVLNGAIAVHAGNLVHEARIDVLRVREVGTALTGLEFAWDTADGLRAVQVVDAEALRALQDEPTLSSAPQLKALRASQRRVAVGRSIGWTVTAAFVFLPVLVLLGFFWQSDRIAGAAAARVPIDEEIRLGDQAFETMRGSLDLHDSGPAYEAVVALGKHLSAKSKYNYRFHVADNKTINAFALPGGIIVVHSGLIDATRRPEELAGVLAHEIQHVEQRHSLQAAIKNLGLKGLWMLVTGNSGSSVLGRAALELTSLTFSREAEAQADAAAFTALVASGFDPSGMPDFFHVLAKEDSAGPPPFLSTHPASIGREQVLRARVKELGPRRFEPLDLGPWPPKES